MRNVQLVKKKYIPRVRHKNNFKENNWFTRHETDRFLNNHCQECVRAYLSIHDCLSFLRQSSDQNFFSRGHDRQSSEQNNRKLISTTMVRTVNMHTDLEISSCWEHIST